MERVAHILRYFYKRLNISFIMEANMCMFNVYMKNKAIKIRICFLLAKILLYSNNGITIINQRFRLLHRR